MRLDRVIEALLFAADTPVSADALARAIGCPIYEVEEKLENYGARLRDNSALQLVRIAGGYQLCTKPEYSEVLSRFLAPQNTRLSRAVLEVLAVVAYRQPVTLAEIEQVRGVDSTYGVHALLDRRLVREVGRKKTPGKPHLYGTTQQFLHVFKLDDLTQLPPLELSLSQDVGDGIPSEQGAFLLE